MDKKTKTWLTWFPSGILTMIPPITCLVGCNWKKDKPNLAPPRIQPWQWNNSNQDPGHDTPNLEPKKEAFNFVQWKDLKSQLFFDDVKGIQQIYNTKSFLGWTKAIFINDQKYDVRVIHQTETNLTFEMVNLLSNKKGQPLLYNWSDDQNWDDSKRNVMYRNLSSIGYKINNNQLDGISIQLDKNEQSFFNSPSSIQKKTYYFNEYTGYKETTYDEYFGLPSVSEYGLLNKKDTSLTYQDEGETFIYYDQTKRKEYGLGELKKEDYIKTSLDGTPYGYWTRSANQFNWQIEKIQGKKVGLISHKGELISWPIVSKRPQGIIITFQI